MCTLVTLVTRNDWSDISLSVLRWRFTFYLYIFTYGVRFLKKVRRRSLVWEEIGSMEGNFYALYWSLCWEGRKHIYPSTYLCAYFFGFSMKAFLLTYHNPRWRVALLLRCYLVKESLWYLPHAVAYLLWHAGVVTGVWWRQSSLVRAVSMYLTSMALRMSASFRCVLRCFYTLVGLVKMSLCGEQ